MQGWYPEPIPIHDELIVYFSSRLSRRKFTIQEPVLEESYIQKLLLCRSSSVSSLPNLVVLLYLRFQSP